MARALANKSAEWLRHQAALLQLIKNYEAANKIVINDLSYSTNTKEPLYSLVITANN